MSIILQTKLLSLYHIQFGSQKILAELSCSFSPNEALGNVTILARPKPSPAVVTVSYRRSTVAGNVFFRAQGSISAVSCSQGSACGAGFCINIHQCIGIARRHQQQCQHNKNGLLLHFVHKQEQTPPKGLLIENEKKNNGTKLISWLPSDNSAHFFFFFPSCALLEKLIDTDSRLGGI
uniref:(northern house mosquito) hypothetical protein n=1 Tax=Culex pipiens TaxID=7175 RepID=A0A8D8GEB1_CULPI